MFKKVNKYIFLCSLCAVALTACKDDDLLLEEQVPSEFEGGSAITLSVTLDAMGGTRSGDALGLSQIENYIDPEKFRVLFFDENENFLFESKSRWIKKVEDGMGMFNEYTKWNVSIPFFSYGNDTEYNWDWKQIRDALTYDEKDYPGGQDLPKFKIAILANRPNNEWYPGFSNTVKEKDPKWFDNSGPHWERENSVAYETYYNSLSPAERAAQGLKAPDVKKIFDLLHAQHDPVYFGKNFTSAGDTYMYNIIGDVLDDTDVHKDDYRIYLGSTSSWVDWGVMDTGNRLTGTLPKVPDLANYPNTPANNGGLGTRDQEIDMGKWGWRNVRLPDENYPIPMYGVQDFQLINKENWEEGTTYNLNNLNDPISLLRSLARLELAFPLEYEVMYMSIFYANVYGRCEPADVWTPTDELWEERHEAGQCKDEESIVEMGPMTDYVGSDSGYPNNPTGNRVTESQNYYWKKLAWIYGRWYDKGWHFGDNWTGRPANRCGRNWFATNVKTKVDNGTYPDYPRIFNPCVQRNNVINIPAKYDIGVGEHRYVVYLPERSPNDPSDLNNIANAGAGKPTVMYWSFEVRNKNTGVFARYSIALGDYDNKYGNGANLAAWLDDPNSVYNGRGIGYGDPGDNGYLYPENNMGNTSAQDSHGCNFMRNYQINGKPSPLPILRNHVYKLKLKPADDDPNRRSVRGERGPIVTSEVKESRTINFGGKKQYNKHNHTSGTQSVQTKDSFVRK